MNAAFELKDQIKAGVISEPDVTYIPVSSAGTVAGLLLVIIKDFCGTEYGLWIDARNEAAQIMKETEGIALEGTYSAKAFAALIADSNNGILKKDAVVLFWNTYCGLDFSALTYQVNYQDLPHEVHAYFESV